MPLIVAKPKPWATPSWWYSNDPHPSMCLIWNLNSPKNIIHRFCCIRRQITLFKQIPLFVHQLWCFAMGAGCSFYPSCKNKQIISEGCPIWIRFQELFFNQLSKKVFVVKSKTNSYTKLTASAKPQWVDQFEAGNSPCSDIWKIRTGMKGKILCILILHIPFQYLYLLEIKSAEPAAFVGTEFHC